MPHCCMYLGICMTTHDTENRVSAAMHENHVHSTLVKQEICDTFENTVTYYIGVYITIVAAICMPLSLEP